MKQVLLFLLVCCAFCVRGQIIITVAGGATGHGSYWGDGGLATNAAIGTTGGLAVDKYGNIFIADGVNQRVRKVSVSSGIITTIAGTGIAGFSGDGLDATNAQLNLPVAVSVDKNGNVYIFDNNNIRIRKVDVASGIITTFVGNGIAGFSGDNGPATNAKTCGGYTAWDANGNMYLNDGSFSTLTGIYYNYRIRKINSAGVINTIAGTGSGGCTADNVQATLATMNSGHICTDVSGNIYFASPDSCTSVHKINVLSGIVTRIAGTNDHIGIPYSGDGIPATQCHIYPVGIVCDNNGNLYISDYENQRIEMVDSRGIITTIAGCGLNGFGGDGGPATNAKLSYPENVAVDPCGNVYIMDYNNRRVRKVIMNPTCKLESPEISPAKILIYPNPATSTLQIDNLKTTTQYHLYNMQGATIMHGILKPGNNTLPLDALQPGIYMLAIIDEEGEKTVHKVVKE